MKELLDLHEKILALPEGTRPEEGVNFSRAEEDREGVDELPEDIQAEVQVLWQAINETLPEGFEYFAFVGDPEEEPSFGLELGLGHAADSYGGDYQPERSLVEQLRETDWEAARAKAEKSQEAMDNLTTLMDRMSAPLRATKAIQREFREQMQPFVREKRADTTRIHVLYWDEEHGEMEIAFESAEELRDMLPGTVARGSEVITVIAWGKPLPVERIDALMKEAQATFRARMAARMEEPAEEEAVDEPVESSGDNQVPAA